MVLPIRRACRTNIIHDNYTIEIIFDNPSIWNLYNIGLWIYISKGNTIGASAWKYTVSIPQPDTVYLEANRDFILNPLHPTMGPVGDVDLVYLESL